MLDGTMETFTSYQEAEDFMGHYWQENDVKGNIYVKTLSDPDE
jgi:hypothetical protein